LKENPKHPTRVFTFAWRTTLRSVDTDTDADIENQDQDQTPDPESRCATTPVSQSRKSTTKTLDEDTQVGDPDAVSSLLLHYRLVCRFWRGSQA